MTVPRDWCVNIVIVGPWMDHMRNICSWPYLKEYLLTCTTFLMWRCGIINVTFVTNTIYKWSWLFNTYYDCNIFKYTIWYTVRTLCCLSSVSVHNGCLKHILKHYYSLSFCLVFPYCFYSKVENCLDLFDQDNNHMVYVLTMFVIYRRQLVLLS